MTASLFDPLQLRETEIPNRVMLSPMCQYSAEEGLATDWHRVHVGSRAVGGAGVVMVEATAVEPRGRISPGDLGIWSDRHADRLAPIAEFVAENGSVPAIQLAHAGRKASTGRPWEDREPLYPEGEGWETISPTDEPYPRDGEPTATRRMDGDDVRDVIDAFRSGAERARDAGFEIAEIHAAHGYLLHEFLSPVTNDRDDEYGGSFENRTRLVREVTTAVREAWPDGKPVFVRISGTDWLPDRDSWDVEQSARLAPLLGEAGADLVDVSSGGIHPDQALPDAGPGYQVPLAEEVRSNADLAVATVGQITEPEHADAIVRNGRADVVALGRELLRHPYWPLEAAHELGAEIEWPIQYERARFD